MLEPVRSKNVSQAFALEKAHRENRENSETIGQIVGKKIIDFTAHDYAAYRAAYSTVVMDIGTGDGKHIYRWAKNHPQDLCIGIDAASNALVKISHKTLTPPAKGGINNCIFLRCAAQDIPAFLAPIQQIHILMPWGSLLRDTVTIGEESAPFMRTLQIMSTPGTTLEIHLNLHAWNPRVPEVGNSPLPTPDYIIHTLAAWYQRYGFTITNSQYANYHTYSSRGTHQQFATSWTKRIASSKQEFTSLWFSATYTG